MPDSRYIASARVRSLVAFALLSLSIALSGAALAASPQAGGEGQYTIGVDVDLVVFNVTVTDNKARHVRGLKASDFQVYEENRLQTITLFDAEDAPATVGLVIDNSGSMREKRADVAKAALAFAAASNAEDEMFVINFNERAYMGLPASMGFTKDFGKIHSALLRTPAAGLTALYDALAIGIEHLKAGSRDRKALVVLSDGGDNASRWMLDDVLQMAQRSSATIYSIGIYDETDRDKNPGVLRKIAKLSGGRAYFPDSVKDLDEVWLDIAGGIRSQYTIGYRSSAAARDGSFRKVKITAGGNGGRKLQVTARDGYLAPAEKSIPR
jgi:Ca-activated chloride channel homolog